MENFRRSWVNTTHDWSAHVDVAHLARIQQNPDEFTPGRPWHLLLEVLAHSADEAASRGGGNCLVTFHPDGSLSVRDDGRGTDTRVDEHHRLVKKPVISTKDLRFFDFPDAELLPDGHPRRGMSVVAALSEWLVHTNRRRNGAWTQRYEYGIPTSGLEPIEADGTTGTLVHFTTAEPQRPIATPTQEQLQQLAKPWPALRVEIDDRRAARETQQEPTGTHL
ncbi:ATP-binding protein [Streptomyces sp. NPDC018019]|uniref:ATP-binding protein n=1 Tax=Streptomyces sp. NPDC018019 TaxID=3365030 RepID=UPI0037A54C89